MKISRQLTKRVCSAAISALFLVLSASPSFAEQVQLQMTAPEEVGMDRTRIERVTDQLQALVDQERLAGMVTIAARDGQLVHFETMGVQDIATGVPMAEDTIFRLFSMSKPITGVALMILYEEGHFHLNDPVSKFIPEFADMQVYAGVDDDGNMITEPAKNTMTMRHLVTHTSGLGYGTMMGPQPVHVMFSESGVWDQGSNLQEMITKIAEIPLLFEPGSEFSYSAAMDVQGYLVEQFSGQSFGDFLQERLFEPLGMVDTGFAVPEDKLNRFATQYHYDETGALIAQELYDGLVGYGEDQILQAGGWGMVSTAMDYMRFSQMLLNGGVLDGVRILSPTTVRLIRTNQLPEHLSNNLKAELGGQPGANFGINMGIVEDPNVNPAGGYSKGEYYWGGATGTWFWIDPVEEVIFVGMLQQFAGQPQYPDVRMISKQAFYQAITESYQD
ncbi:serine hydrolase [Thalassococcus sp. S3]|uniref:serine hydrolase domain-containing protein n=1 Tax=Thalassococcus sp. S3 TaxID=2017482 RepID=UPI001024334C|nr:serine hydrolase domain-containing protein [Thalassococcus sp. S3]QBF32036.1 serine hydrolase [Thalassococcus sp. S3]